MKRRSLAPVAALVLLWSALAAPPLRHVLEATLLGNVLVQIPALVLLGVAAAGLDHGTLRALAKLAGRYAGAALLLFLFVAAFWMLPLSIDRALRVPLFAGAKFVSLPVAGFALAAAWWRLPLLLRGALEAKAYSMGLFMAWFYATVPDRLCTGYRQDEQTVLAHGLLALTCALAAARGLQLLLLGEVDANSPPRRDLAARL